MICHELTTALSANRPQFNARVVEARHRFPAFDTAHFAAFLQQQLDPVVRAVAAAAPDRVGPVVVAGYDMALELVGHSLAGPAAGTPHVDRVWQELGCAYARLVAQQPLEVLGALSNAALNIARTPGARIEEWIDGLKTLAPRVQALAELRALGQLLAWRAGLAHYRAGALASAAQLPPPLALAALGAPETADWNALQERLRADPWAQADGATAKAIAIGAFTGLGGSFRAPPEVRAVSDGFLIRSADRHAFVVADAFGAVLLPATPEEFAAADARAAKAPPQDAFPFDGLAAVANAHTIAISSRWSFAIRLQRRP